jgi:hypothetical protein
MVAVKEFTWEEISSPDFSHPTRAAWREAVMVIAQRAKETLPECHGRVDAAVKIVLSGDVELLGGGKARIASQSNGTTTYTVCNGSCECQDFPHAPSGWCKHRIAAGIQTRAAGLAKTMEPSASAQTAAPTALPEAPASVNCHVTIGGRDVQVTLRDTDESRLLQRLEAVLALYPLAQAAPGAPAQPSAPEQQPTPEGWCIVHSVHMTKQTNQRGSWWSHKAHDGAWCKGK